MKGIRSLILGFFAVVILGMGHFTFATITVDGGTFNEVVVTAKRKPLHLEAPGSEIDMKLLSTNLNKPLSNETSQSASKTEECKGVKLNTNLPFLWKCIGVSNSGSVNQLNAFPIMIKGLMKIIISIVLVTSFLLIVAGGVMMASWGYRATNFSDGKAMITTVAQALAMLGASGVILKLINPNFFN